jgi:cell division protease FtsH
MLGGRIAEEVNYGTLGAGALSDLERSTKMAYAMVTYYGMSKKIGPISYYDSTGTRDTFTKPFSEETARAIDDEVRRILEESYARAREIIEQNNDKINQMADLLLDKETIYAEDIELILGPSAQSLKAKAEKAEAEADAKPNENTEAESGVTITPEEPTTEQSGEAAEA